MRHKLKEIPPEGLTVAEALPNALLDEVMADVDLKGEGESQGTIAVQLFKNGEDVVVNGRLAATLPLSCARCLGPAPVRVDVPVQALFVPELHEHDNNAEDADFDPNEPDRLTHDRVFIDMAPLVRDLLIVNLPMTALCSRQESCRGLCSQCGADRNVTDCGHTQVEPDLGARRPLEGLAALSNLIPKKQQS